MKTTRQQRQRLKTENKKQSKFLTPVPIAGWPESNQRITGVFRSRDFLVQEVVEGENIRLSVNRTEMTVKGWSDNISWDELQDIKRQVGYGDHCAVEIYPKDTDIVNVANMRHLWILSQPLNVGWVNR